MKGKEGEHGDEVGGRGIEGVEQEAVHVCGGNCAKDVKVYKVDYSTRKLQSMFVVRQRPGRRSTPHVENRGRVLRLWLWGRENR